MPTKDRPQRLLQTLQALASASGPEPGWEAVVVGRRRAPASTADVARWVTSAGARRALPEPAVARTGGRPQPRRAAAKGRVLVFLDDDMVVAPGFLARHLRAVDAHPGCWVRGAHHPSRGDARDSVRTLPDARWRSSTSGTRRADCRRRTASAPPTWRCPRPTSSAWAGSTRASRSPAARTASWRTRARAAGLRILYDPENVAHPPGLGRHPRPLLRAPAYLRPLRRAPVPPARRDRRARGDDPGQRSPSRAATARAASSASWRRPRSRPRPAGAAAGPRRSRGARGAGSRAQPAALYDAAVAVAIFRGVREGLVRFPERAG